MRVHVDQLDFSIFQAVPPLRLIDGHARTRWHVIRFGGGLPERPPLLIPPVVPTRAEATYLRHLLDAYADHLSQVLESADDIPAGSDLRKHLAEAREQFYSAESLRAFSRDILPPNEFEKLQDDFHDGVIDEVRSDDHADGYRRVVAVVKLARLLQITAHSLSSRISPRDRGGICHQLANNDRVRWVK